MVFYGPWQDTVKSGSSVVLRTLCEPDFTVFYTVICSLQFDQKIICNCKVSTKKVISCHNFVKNWFQMETK